MSVFAYTNAHVVINSVDVSDHVTKAAVNIEADELETTAMGPAGFRSRIGGLKDWSVELEFNQDFASGQIDATLWPLLGTLTTISIEPVNATVSATNPRFSGSVLVKEYPSLDGSVGDLAKVSVSWPGSGALTRSTS